MNLKYITTIIFLVGIVAWFSFLAYMIYVGNNQTISENANRESTCIQAGFDHYYPNNGITTVQGQTYISCEREQIQDGVLNRTERWISYNETKP